MMKSGENNLRNSSLYQTVEFAGQEDHNSVGIYSSDVTVVPSSGGHNQGSSKIILKNVVDFTWEHRYYTGQLLAIHMSGKYLAYGIKIESVPGNTGPAVRVVNKQTEQRKLLKGMKVAIQDLSFAHIPNQVVLACVDCTGSLYVHTIEDGINGITCTKILQLDVDDCSPTSHRVIWCSFIPDEEVGVENDDVSKLLILTRGSMAELWSVNAAAKRWPNVPVKANDPKVREAGVMMEINQHTGTIVEAAISPDGTALATASADGEVKFFQVPSTLPKQSRCIHQWKPHDGRPISSLFFLDDHKACQPEEQFWRFAVTGCDNNTELKIWSCELWECLQTIKFSPSPSGKPPVLKASLDLSSRYLILSDIYNKILYILSLTKSSENSVAFVDTISEFLLPYPILSFAIIDAGRRKIRPAGEFLDDLCSGEDENEEEEQLVIKMYLVQPKSLQECNITFRPAMLRRPFLSAVNDRLGEILKMNYNGLSPENGDQEHANESNHSSSAGLNLMTPDAFSSPAKKDGTNNLDSQESTENVPDESNADAEPAVEIVAMEEQAPPSGGSSPSREVREILSLAQPEEIESETKSESASKQQPSDYVYKQPQDMQYVLYENIYKNKNELTDTDGAANPQSNIACDNPSPPNVNVESKWNIVNDNIFTLRNKIDSLFQTIQEQRQELSDLRVEMSRLRQETPNMSQVENTIGRALQQENAKLDQTFYNQLTRQRELVSTMENAVKEKIEQTVPRVVDSITEPFKHQLRLDIARVDELMRENYLKTINSPAVRDTIVHTAGTAVKVALDSAFREAFMTNLLPALEKTCEGMFKQIEESFVRGTKQYLMSTDGLIEKRCQKRNEAQQELIATTIRKEMQSEMTKGINVIQESTMRTLRDSFRDNFSQHMSEMSRATTPAISVTSSADTQSRVLALLQRGQLNAAFQQALSASDLDLVMMVCEKTDPANVFSSSSPDGSTRCILAQPVILSLVQQLSADFSDRPQLKHKWLEEAILNLDPNDPVTREHMANVLMPMQNKLATFLNANPNHKYARRMKVLAMAAGALLSHHA